MSIIGLRFVERNQKRILQQQVAVYRSVNEVDKQPLTKIDYKWQDVPLEEETCEMPK